MSSASNAVLVAVLVAALLLAGCHGPEGAEVAEATFTVSGGAEDPRFVGNTTLPAGPVRVTLVNEATDLHHAQFVRVPETHNFQGLREALRNEPAHPPVWAVPWGGPNAVPPGASSVAWVDFEPGSYALMDVIPAAADGVPHVAKGLLLELRVEDDADDVAPNDIPDQDVTVSMVDFGYDVDGTMTSDVQAIRAVSAGGQPHELTWVKLDDGATVQDVVAALGPNATGPPPATFMGGITALAADKAQVFEVDLEPGRYGMICFVEDPGSGEPHYALGMMQDVEVSAA